MSAPGIPNLNTLRLGRGGRSRSRGRGGSGVTGTGRSSSHEAKDKVVQETDQDASVFRMSAVELGYLEDPYAKFFAQGQTPRRYPIINRGTYVRTAAIDRLVNEFLATDPASPKQIISLGAGSDTRYFRIASRNTTARRMLRYHEFDFPSNTAQKIATIRQTPFLLSAITSTLDEPDDIKISGDAGGTSLLSPTYNIHAVDLRDLVGESGQSRALFGTSISQIIPTLLLSECCLIYLSPAHADAVIRNIVSSLISPPTPLALIIYEQIRPHDPFGKRMVSNLAERGIQLQTLEKYSSLAAQRTRLREYGFSDGQAAAADTDFVWEKWVSEAEKVRVARLEMLDELEEWKLLAQHYCVAWGWRDGGKQEGGEGVFSRAWKNLEGQLEGGEGE